MLELVCIVPFFAGILTYLIPARMGRWVLVGTAALHLCYCVSFWLAPPAMLLPFYLNLSPGSLIVLTMTSLLFCMVSCYVAVSYIDVPKNRQRLYLAGLLFFLTTMSMVALSDHIVMFWIAIEATTLVTAPLIYVHRTRASLEATWKYVVICSVGIALSLLGSFLVIYAARFIDEGAVLLNFSHLVRYASAMDPLWLKMGFVFIFVGYGTKMGLVPMHTWLPDAHSEAPSPVSALLSGALLNCAFLGVFKTHKVLYAAGLGAFSGQILIAFGILSVFFAGVFMIKQQDYKRLLAYSSVENMGLIAFGTGVGGVAIYGAFLYLIQHALIKSALFILTGTIYKGFGSKRIQDVGQMIQRLPKTGVGFLVGFIGISGLPPFGSFMSKLLIIIGAFKCGHIFAVTLLILCLLFVFIGFSRYVIRMIFGFTEKEVVVPEKWRYVVPAFVLLGLALVLGFYIPTVLDQTIRDAILVFNEGFAL